MSDYNKKPAIRFQGFTDVWEQRKLGDCFSERAESNPNGELLSVTIGSGIRKFFELGRHDNSNEDKSKYKRVYVGDIAYNSMRMWQGASGYSPYNGIVSPAYTVIKPFEGIDSKFFAYLFKCENMIHTFQIHSQGITSDTWNLKFPAFSQIDVLFPSDTKEQKVIADYLTFLDNLITLHQRKYDKLKNIKKSMLEKMFPKNGSNVPEIRFKGFTDAWEQRKLGELVRFSKGTGYSKGDLKKEGTPIILYGRLYTKYETVITDVDTFVEAKPGSVYSYGGEVVVPASGETAEDISIASVVEKSGVLLGGDLNIITPQANIDSAFLAITISNGKPHNDMAKMAQGKSVVHLHNSDLEKIDLTYPKHEEQVQISTYFKSIDNLITLHQRKLEKLKNIKKSMLEKMFI